MGIKGRDVGTLELMDISKELGWMLVRWLRCV